MTDSFAYCYSLLRTVIESSKNHVSIPTISSSQFFRVASGPRGERLTIAQKLLLPQPTPDPSFSDTSDKDAFLEDLRKALYASFLASFVQGLNLIASQSRAANWGVQLTDCIAIWRAGCIIASESIADLLQPVVEAKDKEPSSDAINLLDNDTIAGEFTRTYGSLKRIMMKSTEWDAYVPAMSATLEWIKYCGGDVLPTQFMQVRRDLRICIDF